MFLQFGEFNNKMNWMENIMGFWDIAKSVGSFVAEGVKKQVNSYMVDVQASDEYYVKYMNDDYDFDDLQEIYNNTSNRAERMGVAKAAHERFPERMKKSGSEDE